MMQAYKYKDLYNKFVQQTASGAFEAESIDAETYKEILESHASTLYTPNLFIRIALGLLTAIAVIFSGLLIWLISGVSNDYAFVVLFIFLCIVCYTSLELLIARKQYYNAGVDNVLICCCIIFLISAFFTHDFTNNDVVTSAVMMVFCLWLCIRFTDGFMAMLSFISLYIIVLLLCIKAGIIGQAIAPFILMFLSAAVYIVATQLLKKERLLFYHFSCKAVRLLSLVAIYVSVNFYSVNEAGRQLLSSAVKMPTVLSTIYWLLTILIPVVYLLYGIRKKDLMFMRTAVVLLIATVFTIRYYYNFLPAEVDMLLAGIMLIAVSYALIKYLRTPKHGFSFENKNRKRKELLNAEAIIVAQLFGKPGAQQKGLDYGGGSSGGGGATGNY